MRHGSACLVPLLAGALCAQPASAEMWRIDPASSSVAMTYTELDTPRPGRFETFAGRFDLVMTDLGAARGVLTIEVKSFDTDDPVREGILTSQAWLDAARFPLARFALTRVVPKGPDALRIEGDLTIRDRTRPISFPVTLVETSHTLRAAGTLVFRRRDFDLSDRMTESLVPIGETVELAFDLIARRDGT